MAEDKKPERSAGRGYIHQLLKNELYKLSDPTEISSTSATELQQTKAFGRGEALKLLKERQMASKTESGGGDAGRSQSKPTTGVSERLSSQAVPKLGRGRALPLGQMSSNPLQEFPSQLQAAIFETKVQPMKFSEKEKPSPIIMSGSSGKKCQLIVNFLALRCSTQGVYQYQAIFEPMVDSLSMRSAMIQEHVSVIGDTNAFNGFDLFLTKKLEHEPTTLKSLRASDNVEVTINLTLVKILAPEDCIPLYNIIFKKIMTKLKMVRMGRNCYLPSAKMLLPKQKLEIWPGYVTAVSNHEGGVMLNLDVSHRVLRTQTALELITELMVNKKRDLVHKLLIGNMVITRYNNKVYRVDDIEWNVTPASTFDLYTGETMTYMNYYKKMYNITIEDEDQPLLISRLKRKDASGKVHYDMICLVPELSFLTGLTDELRDDHKAMKDLAFHTRLTPSERYEAYRKFTSNVNDNLEARHELEKWGFTLDTNVMELQGRRLNPETILFANKEVPAGLEADWSRAIAKTKTLRSVDVNNWILVATHRNDREARNFASMYQQCSREMGIAVEKPNLVFINDDRTNTFVNEIRLRIASHLQLVVVLVPSLREDRYNAIKKICTVEQAIPSQVVVAKNVSDQRKVRSVVQKVALQINCKLGGELWAVEIPTKSLMVCGVDVYHDPGRLSSSVVGFVSSMNSLCTRWHSGVRKQEPGEEMISGMKECFVMALKKYYEVNHELPEKIVIYRDGVGDGQLRVVKDYEIGQLKECFKNFSELNYHPKLAVVVVQKRINVRLLARDMGDQLTNPLPGTVLDHTVTRRNWYDFFLVSQKIRHGTVTPGHYVVICDDIGWKPDVMQSLTYKLTHLYYNWSGTIRVPAPCQYAHKLAYHCGQILKGEPNSLMSQQLYFL